MKLHHIGIASDDIESAIQHHRALFNLQPITEIVEDPIQKVLAVLLSAPEATVPIEIVAPLTRDSPLSNILRKGIRIYHLCYLVEDIEKALEEARKQNSLVISRPSPAKLYNGRKIAFIYTPDKYVVEFLEQEKR